MHTTKANIFAGLNFTHKPKGTASYAVELANQSSTATHSKPIILCMGKFENALRRQETCAKNLCATCRDRYQRTCPGGVHFIRSAIRGKMRCKGRRFLLFRCHNRSEIAHEGQAFCKDCFLKQK